MNTSVKIFTSDQASVPALPGASDSLNTVLKAALVTGVGAQSVTINVAGGIATIQWPTAHGMREYGVLRIAGASAAQLNGLVRVKSVVSPTILTAATTAPDGAVSGAITAVAEGAGWQSVFSSTGLLALQSASLQASGSLLRVDDSAKFNALVRVYESMSSIDAGTGPCPTVAQVPAGLQWAKSAVASAAPWIVIADALGFYLATDPSHTGNYQIVFAGDILSDRPGDAYGFAVTGNLADNTSGTAPSAGCVSVSSRTPRNGAYIARAQSGTVGAIQVHRVGTAHNSGAAAAISGTAAYSNLNLVGRSAAGNKLLLSQVELGESTSRRGILPGLYHARTGWEKTDFPTGTLIDGQGELRGHKLMAIYCAAPAASESGGPVFIDVTDWGR